MKGGQCIVSVLDQVDFSEAGMRHKFEDELKRYNKFHRSVLGYSNPNAKHKEIDLRTYAKYVLREGSNEEKRELMSCFKSKIKVTEGVVTIE